MKKRMLAMLLALVLAVGLLPAAALAEETTPVAPVEITPDYSWYSADADTYTIDSVEDLAGLAKLTQGNVTVDGTTLTKTDFKDKTVKLGADITFADNQYWYYNDGTTVYDYRIMSFAGMFDGLKTAATETAPAVNYTITGLKFYKSTYNTTNEFGLFHTVTADGSVKNLTIASARTDFTNCTKHGNRNKFGAIAYTMNGKADSCHVNNVVVNVEAGVYTDGKKYGYTSHTGSMFGYISGTDAKVTNSTAKDVSITVTGVDNGEHVGGFVGEINGGAVVSDCSIEDVYFHCTYKLKRFGGFAGYISYATLENCTATDVYFDIDNYSYETGGFVGRANNSTFNNCNVSKVTIDSSTATVGGDVGGFVGHCGSNVTFTDCEVTEMNLDLISNKSSFGIGGFIGRQSGSNVAVTDCEVYGNIKVTGITEFCYPAGGFIGYAVYNSGTTLTNCRAADSVTNTGGKACGLVGFIDASANVSFNDCTPTTITKVQGAETNPIAFDAKETYEYTDGKITTEETKYVCSVDIGPYNVGYTSIEKALATGATTIYLLRDHTENITLSKAGSYTFNLGKFKLDSNIGFAHGTFTVGSHDGKTDTDVGMYTGFSGVEVKISGGSEDTDVKLATPAMDHHIFLNWCAGDKKDNPTTNFATKVEVDGKDFWKIGSGSAYHTHWAHSSYNELGDQKLHLTFKMAWGKSTTDPESSTVTFEPNDEDDGHKITNIDSTDAKYFTATTTEEDPLTVTIAPIADDVKDLDVGVYPLDSFYVTVEDGSVHTITAALTVNFLGENDEPVEIGAGETKLYGSVSITGPATVNYDNVVVEAGGEIGDYTVPEGVTVTIPAADLTSAVQGDTVTVGSSGSVTVGSTTVTGPVSVDDKGNVTVSAGGVINNGETGGSYTVSDDMTVTVPSDKLSQVTTADGNTTLPEGTTIEKNGDIITVTDGSVTIDSDDKITVSTGASITTGDGITVTGPASVSADGTITVEQGGFISNDKESIKVESGSVTLGSNGDVTISDEASVSTNDGIKVTGPAVLSTETGEITVTEGTVVIEGTTITGSVTVAPDGKITVEEDTTVKVGGIEITGPAAIEKNNVSTGEDDKVNVTVGAGGSIGSNKIPEGTTVTVPVGKIDEVKTEEGNVVLPAGSTVTSGGTTVEVVTGEVTVDSDGKIQIPGTSDEDSASSVTINGTTVTGPASVADGDVEVKEGGIINGITVPEGTTITVPGEKLEDVTVDETKGSITVPAGSTIQVGDQIYEITSGKATVDADGTVTRHSTVVILPTAYDITISSAENGTVTLSDSSAKKGTVVTVTAAPSDGYALKQLTVTDSQGKALTLTELGGGKYSFTMPAGDVTVQAEFAKTEAPLVFTDVPEGEYYYDPVYWAVENGITNGLTETTFGPEESCTRAQVVTFLWRAAGQPEPETEVNPFTDLDETEYYYKAILWAVEQGITNGLTETTFGPDETVTRGQVVTFLYRFAGEPAVTGTNGFTDVDAQEYYAAAVQWAVEQEITNGTGDNTFAPDQECTRGQIVTFLYRNFQQD